MGPIGLKVIKVKGQICFFFLFVPPRSLGRPSPNLEGRWKAAPDISLRGSFFLKGLGHRRQRSNLFFFFFFFFFFCSPTSPRSLGRSSPNLVGRWRAAPDNKSKVKFLYLGSPWSDLDETW